jgi:MFS family permease
MTTADYSLVLTIFGIAYSVFDVPSNFIMKRYVQPSHWLGFLMLCWGILTLAFGFVKNLDTVIGLRFLIGVVEAGFFPGNDYRSLFLCL